MAYSGNPSYRNYNTPQTPKSGKRRGSKEGMIKGLIALAVIGIVLFFIVPWVSVERDFKDEKRLTCDDCDYTSEDEEDFEPYDIEYECNDCGYTNDEYRFRYSGTLYECYDCGYTDDRYNFDYYGTYYECYDCGEVGSYYEFSEYDPYTSTNTYSCPNCDTSNVGEVISPYLCPNCDSSYVGEVTSRYLCPRCDSTEVSRVQGIYECPECYSSEITVKELSGKKMFHFNHDLELAIGEEDEWGGEDLLPKDEYFSSINNKQESYMKDTIWLSFWGLLFVLIIAIIFIVIERSQYIQYRFYYYKPLIYVIFGTILVLFSLLIMTSGLRFIEMTILQENQNQIMEQSDIDITEQSYFLSGYLMFIFGLIVLLMSLLLISKPLKQLEANRRQHSNIPKQRTPKKFIWAMGILIILALIFLPLFPYFGFSSDQEKDYDPEDYPDGPPEDDEVRVLDFSYGSPSSLETSSSIAYMLDEPDTSNINDDLWAISTLFWLSLIFLSIAFIGLAIYLMNRWRISMISLFLTAGIALVVISALSLAYHGFMIMDIYDYADDMNAGSGTKYDLFFGYNYFPLIFSILLLIFSILFLLFVVRESKFVFAEWSARRYYYGNMPYSPPAPQQQPQQQPYAQQRPQPQSTQPQRSRPREPQKPSAQQKPTAQQPQQQYRRGQRQQPRDSSRSYPPPPTSQPKSPPPPPPPPPPDMYSTGGQPRASRSEYDYEYSYDRDQSYYGSTQMQAPPEQTRRREDYYGDKGTEEYRPYQSYAQNQDTGPVYGGDYGYDSGGRISSSRGTEYCPTCGRLTERTGYGNYCYGCGKYAD